MANASIPRAKQAHITLKTSQKIYNEVVRVVEKGRPIFEWSAKLACYYPYAFCLSSPPMK